MTPYTKFKLNSGMLANDVRHFCSVYFGRVGLLSYFGTTKQPFPGKCDGEDNHHDPSIQNLITKEK